MKNVKTDFGAAGDGSTDDTAAFTTAVAAVGAGGASVGQKLFIPDGTYKITGAGVSLASAGSVQLVGESQLGTILSHSAPSASSGTLTTPGDATLRGNIVVENLTLKGADPTSGNQHYAFLCASGGPGLSGIRFDRVLFRDYNVGAIRAAGVIDALDLSRCELTNLVIGAVANSSGSALSGRFFNSRIANNYFHDTQTATNNSGTSWCIYFNGTSGQNVISGNTFKNVFGGAIQTGGSVDATASHYGCTIANNTFELPASQRGIQAVVTNGLSITGNSFRLQNGVPAISFQNDVLGWTVQGNNINSIGATGQGSGIEINSSGLGGLIQGNTVVFPTDSIFGYGIVINKGADLDIVQNYVEGYHVGCLLNTASSVIANLRIHRNRFSTALGAANINPSAGLAFVGNTRQTVGVLLNGASQDIEVLDNRCTNMNAEMGIQRVAGAAGTADRVVFRTGNLNLASHVVQYGGSIPTNFQLLPTQLRSALPNPTLAVSTTFI